MMGYESMYLKDAVELVLQEMGGAMFVDDFTQLMWKIQMIASKLFFLEKCSG